MDKIGEIVAESAIDSLEQFRSTGGDYLVFSNILIYNCIKLYQKEFKSNKIPATFVKFFIYEISGYDYLFDEKLRAFFNEITSKENRVAVMIETFASSFPEFVIKTGEEDYILFVEVGKKDPPPSIIYSVKANKYLQSSIKSLRLALNHYNKSDELRNITFLFKDYLYNTYTADVLNDDDNYYNQTPPLNEDKEPEDMIKILAEEKNLDQDASEMVVKTTVDERQKKSALLTGRQIDIPHQKGRVVSVLFPILPLPSAYPVLTENSRINTDMRATSFLSPSAEITLINRYCFNQVKYSLDFINKRKVIAFDLKKATRFDFNF